ncbi:Qat anti-phage system TatD family nuclease QatD [Hyphobacterium marinum]|uniref:Qat anti-phage system TatD family nuclease QatD n=1 Tax=Hyphobacterium marinum TaxID=3116574 RepID=A0ABU7LUA3_9PROT|nr:Qat anti-phage system TatD family nuclease QatD [Hyphobacterium sp. Y6023]MEE2565133.1 Qat anti-phage system TatD family nuclease QatD [Hyphobacterium sp. Y6023]
MALIDLHCHLDLYPDPEGVVAEAVERGVYILSVTTTPSAFKGTRKLASPSSRIRTSLGLHPEIASAREHELALFESLLPQTDYVGEVGLDGSRPRRISLDRQASILMEILILCARAGGRTITLHSRGAEKLVLDVLETEPLAGLPILHWFTGTKRQIDRAVERGCWFSVGPAMLSSERGRKAVATMPMERVLPETDGPFGEANGITLMPWQAMDIVPELSRLWRMNMTEVYRQIANNFVFLLGAAPRYDHGSSIRWS